MGTRFGWMCALDAIQPERALEQAVAAERAGFDFVVVSDPFHPWVDDVGASGFAWSFLGAVASRTDRVGLMTTVTAPFFRYHPAVIAQAAATLDRLSNGRFRLGVGTGHALHDSALGWPGTSLRDRAAVLREAMIVLRGLLSGEEMSFDGEHFHIDRARLGSPPLHGVPIWMAANGPRSASMAGEIADGLIVSVKEPLDARARVIEPYRSAMAARGIKRASVLATRWSIFARDEREALRAIAPMRGVRVPDRDRDAHPESLRRKADEMTPAELLASYPLVDGPRSIIAAYERLAAELSADEISIQVASVDPLRTIAAVGEQVLPALREE